jgi:hypothetical protein
MLNILHRKKKVKRSAERRAYFYNAAVSPQPVRQKRCQRLWSSIFSAVRGESGDELGRDQASRCREIGSAQSALARG